MIIKSGENSPTVVLSRISGRVQTYVNSKNNKEFGFIITQARRTDPKEYRCSVAFVYRRGGGIVTETANSQILTLEVLGKGSIIKTLKYMFEEASFKMERINDFFIKFRVGFKI